MRRIATIGGILALLLLTGLSAVGDDQEVADEVEDTWAALDTTQITSKVEVKDISGKYADLTQGVAVDFDGNYSAPYPYEGGSYIWTIEQYGSILVGTIESSEGGSYQLLGSTVMDEVRIIYFESETGEGTNLTYEGMLSGKILESGEIVLTGLGYGYRVDPEDLDNYTFAEYFAETTILTPIEE